MVYEVCSHPWLYAVPPFRIAGNLYYVGNRDVSSHLIDTGAGLILLDSAFPQTTYLLLESIRQLGFDPADLQLILHCHGHYDHCGGTRALVELTGAETAMGEADIEILEKRPELSWAPEYGTEFYERFTVDRPLSGDEEVALGNTRIECMPVPGHTPGSLALFFEVEQEGTRYRVGLHGGPGLNTLTSEYLGKYGLPESRRLDYLRSLERVKAEAVDIMLGAHPQKNHTLRKRAQMRAGRNPFVDPGAWPVFIGSLEREARAWFRAGSKSA